MAGLVVAGLIVSGLFLWLREVDKAPKGRAQRAHLPTMAPKADTGHHAPLHAAENDFATVLCRVTSTSARLPSGQVRATAVDVDEVEPGAVETSVTNGDELALTLPPGRWTLAWGFGKLPAGVPLGTVDLVEGEVFHCAVSPQGVPVEGVVVDTHGAPLSGIPLEGCGRGPRTAADGSFHFVAPFAALRGSAHSCTLRARYEDGLLSRYSEAVAVSALTPGPFTLTLDASPVAGMGITLDEREDGIYVAFVHPGTPAEDADLRPGDRILEVDGHDTTGMHVMDFIPYGVGAEGSTVVLDLDRNGEAVRKSFRRERIVRVDTGG